MRGVLIACLCVAGFVAAAEQPTITMLVTAKEQAKILNARRPASERLAEAKALAAKFQSERLAKLTPEERVKEEARVKEQERIAKLPMEERHVEFLKQRKARAEEEAARLVTEIADGEARLKAKADGKPSDKPGTGEVK